jgi:SAM-dependent methyltransferase
MSLVREIPANSNVREFMALVGLNPDPAECEPNKWLQETHGIEARRQLGDLVDEGEIVSAYSFLWQSPDVLDKFAFTTSGATILALEKYATHCAGAKKIIDVGCGTGLVANYLAWRFPNAQVVGVDSSGSGLNAAVEMSQKLGLRNVTFVPSWLQEFSLPYRFDVVISSLVVTDILDLHSVYHDYEFGFEDEEKFEINLAGMKNWYSELLANLVGENGTLLTLERLGGLFQMTVWAGALSAEGLNVNLSESEFMYPLAWQGADRERMPLFVAARKGTAIEIDALKDWYSASPMPDMIE